MDERRAVRVGFFAALLAIFAGLAWLIVRPFLSFVLAALLLAFVLSPLHRRLAARVDPRLSAGLLVVAALAVTVAAVATLLVTLPVDAAALAAAVEGLPATPVIERRLEAILGTEVPLQSILEDLPRRFAELLVGDVSRIVGAAVDAFLGTVLFVFLVYYLLTSGDALVAWIRRSIPLAEETTVELLAEARRTTWAVLEGHVFVAFVQGIVAGVGLLVVGIPYVVFWTLVMMVLELFPILGVAGVLGPAVVYLVLVDRLLAAAFLTLYGLTAVAAVDDYLRAYVVDLGSSLHVGVVLVGVFGGVYVFGVMGLFYGPIVLGLFQAMVRLFTEEYVEQ